MIFGRIAMWRKAMLMVPFAALLLALVLGAQAQHFSALQELISKRNEQAAQAGANAIADELRDRVSAIEGLAHQASVLEDSKHALTDASYWYPKFDIGLAHLKSDGTLLLSTKRSDFWTSEPFQQALQLQTEKDAGTLSKQLVVVPDPTSGEMTVVVKSSLEDGSVVVGATTLDTLLAQALDNTTDSYEQVSVMLIDDNYQIIFADGQPLWSERELREQAGITEALEGKRGTANLSAGIQEQIVAFSPVPSAPWALVIYEPWQFAVDPILIITEIAPLALVPTLMLAVIALWFIYRQVIRPLQALENQTAMLARGNYDVIEVPIGGIQEIQGVHTELVKMARRVNRTQRSLRNYLGAVTLAQEEERGRLARDLHDDTIQSLIALTRKSQLARRSLNGQAQAEQLHDIENMAKKIIDDLRRISRDLRPIYLDELGLTAALSMLVQETSSLSEIPITFNVTDGEQRVSPDVELALYRVAQETLSNTVRHADASSLDVQLIFEPNSITQIIADNGRGFAVPDDPAEITSAGHFGILGLHERAELIGAHLSIHSKPGQGTRVTITVPLQESRAQLQ